MTTAQSQAAVFEWQEGLRRLGGVPVAARASCEAVVAALHSELRRRLGATFTVAELAEVYTGSHDWFLGIALRIAPRGGPAHDAAVTLDGAFARFARHAQDGSLW